MILHIFKNPKRNAILFLISSYVLYMSGIVYLWQHPETTYVLFIFTQSSKAIFILTMSAMSVMAAFILISIKRTSKNNTLLWISGTLLLTLIVLSSIFLWRILGYYFIVGMDIYNYIGMAKDIIHFSHVPQTPYYPSFYPAQPLLYAILHLVSSISVFNAFVYAPALYYLMSVLILYLTSKYLINQTKNLRNIVTGGLVSILVLPNFFNEFIYPYNQTFSIIIFGVVIYIYLKYQTKKELKYQALLLPVLIVLPFTHPIPAYIMGLILLGELIINRNRYSTSLFGIYTITFIAWILIVSTGGLMGFALRNHMKSILQYTTAEKTEQLIGTTMAAGKSITSLIAYTLAEIHPILLYSLIAFVIFLKSFSKHIMASTRSHYPMAVTKIIKILWLPILGYTLPSTLTFLHNPTRLALDNPFIYFIVPVAIYGIIIHLSNGSKLRKPVTIPLVTLAIVIILTSSILLPAIEYKIAFYPSKTKTWQEPISVRFYETYNNPRGKIYAAGSQTQIGSYISKDLGKVYHPRQHLLETLEINDFAYIFILRKTILTYTELYPGYKYTREFFTQTYIEFELIYSNDEVKIFMNKEKQEGWS
ncbi:hypothetical protein CL1_0835 [Thermococcus cleftensis]|uniref:Uncharacterized protein n=1 Tax=Thermococcus cleftensis (strain DSM 27260 / KACC 17922 / CL1) TaxID=163003 RepID=I3ZTK6_THECF|nr:hypothetical protein [Thermococcus cleftensis]AFL95040.1 hypothetical protein CL1_0835 [Thermococcus cleftensis]